MMTKIEGSPVPQHIGDSVAVDLGYMPPVTYEGVKYDCMVLAVDRLSGWTIAVPTSRKGGKVSAKAVAKLVLPAWVEMFGVPSVVTSDQGPQFAAVWWKTLCSMMGVRRVYAQAHHHQANGRAEVQIREFKSWLSRLTDGGRKNWVEYLPLVRRLYHDTPGITDHSPYQIVFGRTRLMEGVSYPEKTCVEAEEWFKQQRDMEHEVYQRLKDRQEQKIEQVNRRRREAPSYAKGDKVWVRRSVENKEAHLRSMWTGPYLVVDREGNRSYVVGTGKEKRFHVHASQMKPCEEDTLTDKGIPLYYYQKTEGQQEEMEDTWKMKKILGHRTERGQLQFLVEWEGGNAEQATWQPVKDFFHEYCGPCVAYANEHGLASEVLHALPTEDDRRVASLRGLVKSVAVSDVHSEKTATGRQARD
jgi:hypothetical protein